MKINPIHSLNMYRKSQEVKGKQDVNQVNKRDEVKISSEAKQMQATQKTSLDRQEKINDIKAQIENGTYQVDAKEVARKFHDFWSK
ncbi:flagellar biosynthesis anti-sigma factor FlgM [Bacillus shivajii]|uniref:flagellar biosynthesis anti-sigma factor FlgM n=1 Tax=Bacillus shivajii TaxID=1983719 RepID=UPI001CFAD508|nr:flagellar biosynthesis anti-sigma factor FlgM [Bacillus shivajii]UCZ52697.1 flagellar biosynthesis anti-sigma factor FlgM [Bacillus shivajii]